MIEVQGNSVRLYLEGLMFFALDEKQKRLEAGVLNVNDGHNLKVRTFRRNTAKPGACCEESWKENEPVYISDSALRRYDYGDLKISSSNGEARDITSPIVPRNREIWMPFDLIPDFEEIVGSKVTLDRNKVRPVFRITGGNYFSVLTPDHVQAAKPLEKRASTRGFISTYRFEKGQLEKVKTDPNDGIVSVKDLISRGVVAKDLGIRAYTAATMITLNDGEQLVCTLKSEKDEQFELFRVNYEPGLEAKVILVNGVSGEEGSHVHPQSESENSDSMPFFHFLNYYKAIAEIDEKKQFVLANEEMLVEFFNNDRKDVNDRNDIEMTNQTSHGPEVFNTGGDDPGCPAVFLSTGLNIE